MRRILLIVCCSLLALAVSAQSRTNATRPSVAKDSTLIKIQQHLQAIEERMDEHDYFKLYPTENIHIFLQLDTRTGKIDMLQWDFKAENEFCVPLNERELDWDGRCGTFELYPTKNIYQFILLNKFNGLAWHVQWGIKKEERFVRMIM